MSSARVNDVPPHTVAGNDDRFAGAPPPQFSIVTCTFNREHFLPRLYRSLLAQNGASLEWVIADDASTDGTARLVAGWLQEAKMRIVYVRLARNGHKKTAFATALRHACGELVAPLDDDDELTPQALSAVAQHWAAQGEDRRKLAGVIHNSQLPDGTLVGSRMPPDVPFANGLDLQFFHGVRGDKHCWTRREVFDEIDLFADLPGFIYEGSWWYQIAGRYRYAVLDRALRVYWQDASGSRLSQQPLADIVLPKLLLSLVTLRYAMPYLMRAPLTFAGDVAMVLRMAPRVGWGRTVALVRRVGLHPLAACLILASAPLSAALYVRDSLRLRREAAAIR